MKTTTTFLSLLILLSFSCKTIPSYHYETNKDGNVVLKLNNGSNETSSVPIYIKKPMFKCRRTIIRKEDRFIYSNYKYNKYLKDTLYVKDSVNYHIVYITTDNNDSVELYFKIIKVIK